MVFCGCGEIEALSPEENTYGGGNKDNVSSYTAGQRLSTSPPFTAVLTQGHDGEDLVQGTFCRKTIG